MGYDFEHIQLERYCYLNILVVGLMEFQVTRLINIRGSLKDTFKVLEELDSNTQLFREFCCSSLNFLVLFVL